MNSFIFIQNYVITGKKIVASQGLCEIFAPSRAAVSIARETNNLPLCDKPNKNYLRLVSAPAISRQPHARRSLNTPPVSAGSKAAFFKDLWTLIFKPRVDSAATEQAASASVGLLSATPTPLNLN